MTEPNVDPESAVNDPAVKQDEKKTVDSIPYARFKEVNDELKAARDKLDELKEAQKKARAKKMEEDGKLKELLKEKEQEIEQLQVKSTAWDSYQADRRQTLLGKLPEEDRELYDELSLIKLEKVVEKLSTNKVPRVSGGSPMGRVKGYDAPADAAIAYAKGEIDKPAFQKIREAFRQKTAN